MLNNEAIWISDNLYHLKLNSNSVVLNFGSQNQKYNRENKYLMDYVINPIRKKCLLRNLDLQSGVGIDYSGNLYEDVFFNKMKLIQFDCVLLCNVLEHIDNIEVLTSRVIDLIKPGGFIVFTGPNQYPVHYDPIDNGFRPEIEQILSLFKGFKKIKGDVIVDHTYSFYLFRNLKNFTHTFLRVLTPFYKYKKWKDVILPKFIYWNRKFKVTCVILQKNG
jgi:SAM-dependent methyltransferase